MNIQEILIKKTTEAINELYQQNISSDQITLQKTRPEFDGDITLLVFPLTRTSKKSPEETANAIGNYLKENVAEVTAYNVVKGFLNLVIADSYWINYLQNLLTINHQPSTTSETVMVEFSSPNTNKPLHLGHIRNNLLGASVSEILKAAGKKVIRVNLVNDRGIHICKSMLAWHLMGKNETPASSGIKGDHLVGKYYVRYNEEYEAQIKDIRKYADDFVLAFIRENKYQTSPDDFKKKCVGIIIGTLLYIQLFSWKKEKQILIDLPDIGEYFTDPEKYIKQLPNDLRDYIDKYRYEVLSKIMSISYENPESDEFKMQVEKTFQDYAPLIYQTHKLLREWEEQHKIDKGDVLDLWKKMNGWVYEGFAETYKELGIEFEKTYYESQTYLLGKEIVEEGVKKEIFTRRKDNSVWVDLTKDGLDEKLLLRGDGTSVYITQDLGTIIQRSKEFHFNKHVYVVGNEQEYHFKVLFLILKKLGYDWAEKLYHLSYGMVDLPSGKMKSREGTVVDADDLISEMVNTARETTKALGKTDGMNETEAETLYHNIGLGALKYFILKVDPKKRMLFDPKESIDFNGNTGPFIQYTYARIQSVLRKAKESNSEFRIQSSEFEIQKKEKNVIKLIHDFSSVIKEAADAYSPAFIANYVYELAKEYNQFYHEFQILKAEKEEEKNFRLLLSEKTAEVIKTSLKLLGINSPERM